MANVMEFPDTVEEFMELYRVTDTDHVYSNGTDYVPIFRMKQWFEHLRPLTNADRIRSMTNEELAEWFQTVCTAASECSCSNCKFDELECTFEKWLGQEVE